MRRITSPFNLVYVLVMTVWWGRLVFAVFVDCKQALVDYVFDYICNLPEVEV